MENLEKIEKILKTANSLRLGIKQYSDYQKNPSKYDKLGFGFNNDKRFAAHDGLYIRLDTWKGVYGDSGCSRIVSIDSDIFNTHLLKAIEKHKWVILADAEASMLAEAIQFKEQAKKELEDKLEKVNAL